MHLLPSSQFLIYRDDLNHPTVSGNKLHKLGPNIEQAISNDCSTVLSFGGPYSNHLHALAWACSEAGLNSIAVVRGELHPNLTPTLRDCQQWGMQLIAAPRAAYRDFQNKLAELDSNSLIPVSALPGLARLTTAPQTALLLPEGGSNNTAISALASAYKPLFEQKQYAGITHVVCATGTGATVTGLRLAAPKHVEVLGVQAVAEGSATRARVSRWLNDFDALESLTRLTLVEGHLGGFAKMPSKLIHFMDEFEQQSGVPLDPIYNAKVMFKLTELLADGFFKSSDKVLIINTGGLQGKRGLVSHKHPRNL